MEGEIREVDARVFDPLLAQATNAPVPFLPEVPVMPVNRFIEVTTLIGCGMVCRYCPQSELLQRYAGEKQMSLELFRSCVDKLPADVDVHFSGFAEPWLNPHASDMLLYAHSRGHKVEVFSTLRGMTVTDIYRMRNVELSGLGLCVHLPDADGLMRLRIDSDYLLSLRKVQAMDEVFTQAVQFMCIGRLHPVVADCIEQHEVRYPKVISRAGNVEVAGYGMIAVPAKVGAIRCSRNKIGQQPVLLPNGDLYLCCCDYGLKHKMGNLLRARTFDEIWHGPDYIRFLQLLNRNESDLLCRRCEAAVSVRM